MKILKINFILMPLLGLSLMGNKGCDDKKKDRLLRMDVEIGQMKTLPLQVNQEREIQIDQLSRELFGRAIFNHQHFTIVNTVPRPPSENGNSGDMKLSQSTAEYSSMTATDLQILKEYGFNLNSTMNHQNNQYNAKTLQEVPRCQWDRPQLILNSDVIGFELVNSVNLGLGYSPSGTHIDQLNGKVKFVNFRLDYGITAIHPLLNRVVVATEAVEHQSSVEVEFDFGQNSPITIDFFFQEALVKVIKDGMKKSLNRLEARLQEQTTGQGKDWNKDVWESRVILDPAICGSDDCVAIRGGTLNNIKIGDEFSVANMIHTWEGNPCESNLIRSIADLETKNTIVIESVGDTVSIGRVQKSNSDNSGIVVEPGAMVKVEKLNEPKKK